MSPMYVKCVNSCLRCIGSLPNTHTIGYPIVPAYTRVLYLSAYPQPRRTTRYPCHMP